MELQDRTASSGAVGGPGHRLALAAAAAPLHLVVVAAVAGCNQRLQMLAVLAARVVAAHQQVAAEARTHSQVGPERLAAAAAVPHLVEGRAEPSWAAPGAAHPVVGRVELQLGPAAVLHRVSVAGPHSAGVEALHQASGADLRQASEAALEVLETDVGRLSGLPLAGTQHRARRTSFGLRPECRRQPSSCRVVCVACFY